MNQQTRYADARSRRLEALARFEAVATSSQSCSEGPWSRDALHERDEPTAQPDPSQQSCRANQQQGPAKPNNTSSSENLQEHDS
jgi:hypothetical protein